MISAATFRASAPAVSIEPLPLQPHQLAAGQVVKAQVLERLSAEKSLISIGGVHMHATTEIAVAPGDVLYFTVRSAEPLVLQLHGMEYRTINPFSTVESLVRLLNLTSDRTTISVLSYMLTRNKKISKAEIEENRRLLGSLRSEGTHAERDEELLELIDELRSKQLPLSSAYIHLAKKRMLPEDISRLSETLLALLETLESVPGELRDPILGYFKKRQTASEAIRSAAEALGLDYEHSLIAWGVGSTDAAKTGTLKAALMALVGFLEGAAQTDAHARLQDTAARLIDGIEAQQFTLLGQAETDPAEFSLQIPVALDGVLHTVSLSIMDHGNKSMFQDAPREYSFRMTIELSELGCVTVMGRLAGRQLSASVAVDDDGHVRALEEGFGGLAEALRKDGCSPMSLAARKGLPGASLIRRTVNASA